MSMSNPWDEDLQLVNDLLAARYAEETGFYNSYSKHAFLASLEPYRRLNTEVRAHGKKLLWDPSSYTKLEVQMTLDEAMERLQLMHDLARAGEWTNKKLADPGSTQAYRAWLEGLKEVWHPIRGNSPVWVTNEGVSAYLRWNSDRIELFSWRKQREQQSQTDD